MPKNSACPNDMSPVRHNTISPSTTSARATTTVIR